MNRWILRILIVVLLAYAGREIVLRFKSIVQDNNRAQAELARELAKKRAEQMTRSIEAGQADHAERLNQAVQEAQLQNDASP